MTFVKYILLIVLVCAVGIGAWFGWQAFSDKNNTYSNDKYMFAITYPDGWTIEEEDNPFAVNVYNEEHSDRIYIAPTEFANSVKLDMVVDVWMAYVESALDNVVIVDSNPSGRWDWLVSYSYTSSGTMDGQFGKVYFLNTPKYIYLLQCDGSQDTVDEMSSIVETFKVKT